LRGRVLSLLLVAVGGVLLAGGVAIAVAVFGGPLLGLGVGAVLLGAELVVAGLFLVPTDPRARDRSGGGL
jgi:hypothetical protein